jgi:hypothetical protein
LYTSYSNGKEREEDMEEKKTRYRIKVQLIIEEYDNLGVFVSSDVESQGSFLIEDEENAENTLNAMLFYGDDYQKVKSFDKER